MHSIDNKMSDNELARALGADYYLLDSSASKATLPSKELKASLLRFRHDRIYGDAEKSENAEKPPEFMPFDSLKRMHPNRNENPMKRHRIESKALESAPWMRDIEKRRNMNFYEALHLEVEQLLSYLSPSDVEVYLRLKTAARLQIAAAVAFPGCSCHFFGSMATGLLLPGGDIDVTINISDTCHVFGANESESGAKEKNPEVVEKLYLLTFALQELNICHNVNVVTLARVPIVKYVDSQTGIPVDASINQPSSLLTTEFVRRRLKQYPLLRPLVILLKLFLKVRNLSEVYKGGVGSYLLFCMCLFYMQMTKGFYNSQLQSNILYSHILLEFLYMWVVEWNYESWGACVRGGGHLFFKNVREHAYDVGTIVDFPKRELLCFESPLAPEYDLGRSSFNIQHIRMAFTHAFLSLLARQVDWGNKDIRSESILTILFDPKNPIFVIRESVTQDKLLASSKMRFQIGNTVRDYLDKQEQNKKNKKSKADHLVDLACEGIPLELKDRDIAAKALARASWSEIGIIGPLLWEVLTELRDMSIPDVQPEENSSDKESYTKTCQATKGYQTSFKAYIKCIKK